MTDANDQLANLRTRLAKIRAEAQQNPNPTPTEAAAALHQAVTIGTVIVCHATCWSCKFGQCNEPPQPHPWWDEEDVDHAATTGRPAPTGNCACPCARTEEPQP